MAPFVSKLKRTYWNVVDIDKHDSDNDNPFDPYPNHGNEVCVQVSEEQANTIASLLEDEGNLHAPAIDIDWRSELHTIGDHQELDVWCQWPFVSSNLHETARQLKYYCDKIRSYGFISAVLFSGDFRSIHYQLVFEPGVSVSLVPSKSYQHFHLYIEKPIPWYQYQDFLYFLNKMGIVQNGFFGMTVTRGMSHLRKPNPDLFVIEI